jgi:hypothetical protein
MAGSYKHIVNSDNTFIGVRLLDHLGDAWGALEECHWMIKYLAGGDLSKIFEAHRAYVAAPDGCNNPDYAAKMSARNYWGDKEDDVDLEDGND